MHERRLDAVVHRQKLEAGPPPPEIEIGSNGFSRLITKFGTRLRFRCPACSSYELIEDDHRDRIVVHCGTRKVKFGGDFEALPIERWAPPVVKTENSNITNV